MVAKIFARRAHTPDTLRRHSRDLCVDPLTDSEWRALYDWRFRNLETSCDENANFQIRKLYMIILGNIVFIFVFHEGLLLYKLLYIYKRYKYRLTCTTVRSDVRFLIEF